VPLLDHGGRTVCSRVEGSASLGDLLEGDGGRVAQLNARGVAERSARRECKFGGVQRRCQNLPDDDKMVVESDSHLLRPSFVRRKLLLVSLVHQNHVNMIPEKRNLRPARMVADPGYRAVGGVLVEEALAEDLEESRRACEERLSRAR